MTMTLMPADAAAPRDSPAQCPATSTSSRDPWGAPAEASGPVPHVPHGVIHRTFTQS